MSRGTLFALLMLLAACGGGGSSGSTPPRPPVAPTPTPTPASLSIDCSLSGRACPTLNIAGDQPAAGGFHGYADPSMRRDPNSGTLYLAYSWPRVLSDSTHVVDLHLAHSADGGTSWSYDGPLYVTQSFSNPGGGGYAASNQTSAEVMDLLPVNQGSSTLWLQVHMAYLVPAGSTSIYAQLDTTNYLSLTALSVPATSSPATLLGLGTATEARLGNAGTDGTLHPNVNLTALSPALAKCVRFNEPTLWAAGTTLYLAAQCTEGTGHGDASQLTFPVFSTHISGSDPVAWTWTYLGEMATPAQAQKLGTAEGTAYQYFTEMQFASGKSGQLLAILTPAAVSTTGQQPAIHYGCRAIPIASLSAPALQTDSSGTVVVASKVTESDLYAGQNEGPGACSYESSSSTGIVIVRKLEADPVLGFFVSLQSSGMRP